MIGPTRGSLLFALLLAGCVGRAPAPAEPTPVEEPPTEEPTPEDPCPCPEIIASDPAPNGHDFVVWQHIRVQWDLPPKTATLQLLDSDGAEISAAYTPPDDQSMATLDPDEWLVGGAAYSLVVRWEHPTASPTTIEFATLDGDQPIPDPSPALGRVYSLDLAGATFLEPPGLGLLLGAQMADFRLLFSLAEPSSFALEDQPGLRAIGAPGIEVEDVGVFQDPCLPVFPFSDGEDAQWGTDDDIPGIWSNPQAQLGARLLPLTMLGTTVPIHDMLLTATFDQAMEATHDGTFEGRIDTRPMAEDMGPDADPGAFCEAFATNSGVECVPCQAADEEAFCLELVVLDIIGTYLPDLVIVERGCAEVIEEFVYDGSCSEEAGSFDQDGDGLFEGCPEYVP